MSDTRRVPIDTQSVGAPLSRSAILLVLVVGTLAAMLLSGCAPETDPGPFGAERSSLDVLPSSVDDEGLDPRSVRYLGMSRDGIAFYAAMSASAEGDELFCLISFTDEMTWSTVCDTHLPVTAGIGKGPSATLYASAPSPPASQEVVGEYVVLGE